MLDRPYFMENRDWFTYDVKKRRYVLTDKAPERAKKSYEEFYKALEMHNNG